MTNRFRNVLGVVFAAAVLTVSTAVPAGVVDKVAGKLRDQKSEQRPDQSSDKKSDKKSDGRSVQRSGGGRNAQPQRDDRVGRINGSPAQTPAPRDDNHNRDRGGGNRGDDRNNDDRNGGNRGGDRDDDGGGNQGQGSSRDRDLRDDLGRLYGDSGGNGNRDRHGYRPPRVVDRLPAGYRDYHWNGDHYYSHGGHWYRPYGNTYITVGIPFGLFVSTLPGLYTSVWFEDTRYYYADRTYYLYEPARRGYVVTRSPYGDDEDYHEDEQGDDLYIYPAQGQSEQQQADDRYGCHRWAVDQSRYDPLDDEYDADKRANYRRAITACLTGRGYTVN